MHPCHPKAGWQYSPNLKNINFTYVGRHNNVSLALFRTVVETNESMTKLCLIVIYIFMYIVCI